MGSKEIRYYKVDNKDLEKLMDILAMIGKNYLGLFHIVDIRDDFTVIGTNHASMPYLLDYHKYDYEGVKNVK